MSALLNLLHGLLVVIGRLFGQALNGKREHDNRRRDVRVQFLVDAWRSIERAANGGGSDEMRGLAQAIADIQLFGTPSQAEQAASVARTMNERKTNTAALDDLLEALRLDLRDEMRLGRTNARLVYLRDGYAMEPLGAARSGSVRFSADRCHGAVAIEGTNAGVVRCPFPGGFVRERARVRAHESS